MNPIHVIHLALLIIAAIIFLIASLPKVDSPINLVAFGAFFFVLSFIVV